MLASHVRRVCRHTSYRFPVDKYNWPPEQPKDFTPVILIHYQDQYDTTPSYCLSCRRRILHYVAMLL